MTNEQNQVMQWMASYGQDCPTQPVIPSLEVRRLRAKLILEEALETVEGLGIAISIKADGPNGPIMVYDTKIDDITFNGDVIVANLEQIADGCEDLKVVTDGTLVACGLCQPIRHDVETKEGTPIAFEITEDPMFREVMRSNWSKMWTDEEVHSSFGTDYEQCHQFTVPMEGPISDTYSGWTGDRQSSGRWLIKDSNGKVIKSPSYSPPVLGPLIEGMKEKTV